MRLFFLKLCVACIVVLSGRVLAFTVCVLTDKMETAFLYF